MSTPRKVKKAAKPVQPRRRLLASLHEEYVRNCAAADKESSSRETVSLRFHEIFLRHSDVQLLRGPHVLNERVISFYLSYLQNRRYKTRRELFFLAPDLTRNMRLLDGRGCRRLAQELQLERKLFIFVPLDEGAHWSLLLVSRPDRKIYYFDSEDNRHLILARLLAARLRSSLLVEDYTFTVGRCLQQAANMDHESGVHFMCMIDNMVEYISHCGFATSTLLVSIQEVRFKRASLLQLIRTLGGSLSTSLDEHTSN